MADMLAMQQAAPTDLPSCTGAVTTSSWWFLHSGEKASCKLSIQWPVTHWWARLTVNISLTFIRAPDFNVTQPIFWHWESAAGDFCGLLVVADKRLQHESWTEAFKVLLKAVDQLFPAEMKDFSSVGHSRCVGNVSSSIISVASDRIIFSCFSRVRWHNVWLHAKWITLASFTSSFCPTWQIRLLSLFFTVVDDVTTEISSLSLKQSLLAKLYI